MTSKPPETQISAQVGLAAAAIERARTIVSVGTADSPRAIRRIDLALVNAEDRMQDHAPALHIWERDDDPADASIPNPEAEENRERARVARQARLDYERLKAIGKELDTLQREMTQIIDRQVERIIPTKRPKDTEGLPGCISCARSEGTGASKIGGHFAPVYEKSLKSGLCRWCWRCRSATGQLPPILACHKFHTEGPRAAGLWLARNMPETNDALRTADEKPKLCGHPTGKNDAPCARPFMHDGECRAEQECHTPAA